MLTAVFALALLACGSPDDTDPTGTTATTTTTTTTGTTQSTTPGTLSVCNSSLGFTAPLEVCSVDNPCTTSGGDTITSPSELAECRTNTNSHPFFDDGAPNTTVDADGTERSWCTYLPPGSSPRPLVLYFHGTSGAASDTFDYTSLRAKAATVPMGPNDPGFVLVTVQGRNLHWPTADARDESHFDIYHRSLGAPSTNPDVVLADQITDDLVASGDVDPDRIYTMGWSNGGFFAQMYAIARHETATPGGQRVAASAVFSAADPFQQAIEGADPSCALDPYPTSNVPIHVIGRACDLIPCDQAQATDLIDEGYLVQPGAVVNTWMADLVDQVGSSTVERRIVDVGGDLVSDCTAPIWCGLAAASLNHLLWPDGVSDGSGNDHELTMLQFLASHPLP